MKTFFLRPALLVAALFGPPAAHSVASERGPVIAFRALRETINEPVFGRGMPANEVLRLLGEPDERLAQGLWVYWDYRTNRTSLNAQGLDTLVIAISHETVVGLKIVPRQSLEPFVTRVPPVDASRAFVAK